MSTPTIYEMPGHLIRRLQQISTSVFQSRMRSAGLDLTAVQFAALDALSRANEVDQATLAGLIAYDRATIGTVVDRLENRGLVTRSQSKQDRRARLVSITPAGQDLLSAAHPIVSEFQNEILAGLSKKERTMFLNLARKIAATGNSLSRAPLVMPEDE